MSYLSKVRGTEKREQSREARHYPQVNKECRFGWRTAVTILQNSTKLERT
jgi:hypothetical protein